MENNKKVDVKLLKDLILKSSNLIEEINETYDPFQMQLKGFHDQINKNIDKYNDILEEICKKINQKV